MDIIGRDLAQILWLLHHTCPHSLRLAPAQTNGRYNPFIESTGNHKGLQGTARDHQREDQAHRPGRAGASGRKRFRA
jgi:hypothetical protein